MFDLWPEVFARCPRMILWDILQRVRPESFHEWKPIQYLVDRLLSKHAEHVQ